MNKTYITKSLSCSDLFPRKVRSGATLCTKNHKKQLQAMHRSVRTWVSQHQRLMCWRPRDDGMVWLDASVSEKTVWPWEKNWPNRLAKCHWDSLRLIETHWDSLIFLRSRIGTLNSGCSISVPRSSTVSGLHWFGHFLSLKLGPAQKPKDWSVFRSQFLCRSPLHSLHSLLQPEACLIALNVAWDLDGSLGFSDLDSRTMSGLGWICTAIAFFGGWIHTFIEAQP